MAVTMLALGQMAYLFNTRSLRDSSLTRSTLTGNPVIWISLGTMLALQIGFVYLPFMNAWFNSAPLPLSGWAIPLALSVVVFILAEVGKAVMRRRMPAPDTSATKRVRV
jgi:magnesium-transporting ATPase (P-type)